ncbi:MAG: hypothetical protein ABUL67_03120 [Haliangium ochraceum]
MRHRDDEPMYRTFEEFEREELRRAETIAGSVDALFDGMFEDDLDFDASATRQSRVDDLGDEEE